MAAPASSTGTTLPLSWRLRRAFLVALLLGLWAPVKIVWEQHIAREQDFLRYRGTPMTRQLRDQLSQGLTIGVLSGMRSVVADLVWLESATDWIHQNWFAMSKTVSLCTALQPRAPLFWEMGGWQLAWNASIFSGDNPLEPNPLKRMKASRFWLNQGREVYQRGLENNPTKWRLWSGMALLYQQRLKDPRTAAYYYQKASEQPDAPIYLERFPAIMYYLAGDDRASYAAWTALWNHLTPAQRLEPQHFAGKSNAMNIRQMEAKLSIPQEKRIFPN
jgi:hypothetical protein